MTTEYAVTYATFGKLSWTELDQRRVKKAGGNLQAQFERGPSSGGVGHHA